MFMSGALAAAAAALAACSQSVAGGLTMVYIYGIGYIVLNTEGQIVLAVLTVASLIVMGMISFTRRMSVRTVVLISVVLCAILRFCVPAIASAPTLQAQIRPLQYYWAQVTRGTDPSVIARIGHEAKQKFGHQKRDYDRPIDVSSVFTEAECRNITDTVFALKDRWETWPGFGFCMPFFTLGSPSYLLGPRYHEHAAKHNPVMDETFRWIYPRVLQVLEEKLGQPVRYHTDSLSPAPALPGFHIFLSNTVWQLPVTRVHVDEQYDQVRSLPADADYDNPLSWTLSVALPAAGDAGLWVFAEKFAEGEVPESLLDSVVRFDTKFGHVEKVLHPYALGGLVVHSGHMTHQIANSTWSRADDARITLQGHGVFSKQEGSWLIYW